MCSECRRKFNPDLRYCPYCGGAAKVPGTKGWNYGERELIRSSDPVEDEHRKAYRQNGFMLLVAIILIIPAYLIGIEQVVNMDLQNLWMSELAFIVYVFIAFVLIAYGTYCAFASKRPGAQILAAILLWVNPGLLHPIAFVIFAFMFCFIWVLGGSKSGSWRRPDATYLGLMTGVGIIAVIWGYIWFFNMASGYISF
ncbi:MAG: hypothetical protein GQ558_08115 [Thermoplasmata archaeon]|nr:hypothetical protein [Thermoplasmata archaeon]